MDPTKLEMESDSHFDSGSDTSEPSSSSSPSSASRQNLNGEDKGGTEQLKKLRSMKMSRVQSRRFKNQGGYGRRIISGYAASSEQSTPIEMSDASPKYMKATSFSDEKENVQKSAGKFSRRTSSRPVKSMTRLPSMRFRRPLTRTSGGTDQKYLKKSRSIKLANSVTLSRDIYSVESKRASMKKHLEMPQTLDSTIQRATCSSALKGSKVPEDIESKAGGSESEKITTMKKVCPYSYCSLHGHRHENLPPLKRYVSMRRRLIKSQKNVSESRSTSKAKGSGNRKKGIQKSQKDSSFDSASRDIAHESTAGPSSITDEDGPEFSLSCDSSSEKRSITFSVDEASVDSCSITSVQDKSTSEATGSERKENLLASREKQKNMGLWRLIYQHMASGIDAEVDRQKAMDGEGEEKQVEKTNKVVGTNESSSIQDTSPTDQSLYIADHDKDNQKTDISQSDAIKLVQEAFDRILSEIPDQSSDTQSVASDMTSDNDLSIPTSFDSAKDSTEKDTEETQLKDAKVNVCGEEKVASNVGKKSDQQMPKSWNNLKKIILFKRFVKALEKVKHFNPRKPRFLSVEPDPEAERVHLRHLTVEGRKNTDEWMLDHALRQVISTLAPAQKRKVALLVQAFETIVPVPEVETHLRSNSAASSHTTPIQSRTGSSAQSDDDTGKENKHPDSENQEQVTDILPTKWSVPMTAVGLSFSMPNVIDLKEEGISASRYDSKTNESTLMHDQHDSMDSRLPEVEETKLKDESSREGIVNNSQEQSPEKEKTSREVLGQVVFRIDSEARGRSSELEPENDKVPASDIRVVLTDSFTKLMEKTSAIGDEEGKTAHESIQGIMQRPNGVSDAASETKLEKQNYTGLWYLIYKHMASGNAADKEEQSNNGDTLLGRKNSISQTSSPDTNQDMKMENHYDELHRNDVIKLVEEAIDEIPLPDSQDDSPDDQSVTSETTTEEESLRLEHGEGQKLHISTTIDNSKEEPKIKTVENKSKPQLHKNWSNLKKIILLKRFVKALEKVKKFNPREPQYLPLQSVPEAEKVNLRHQNTDDRKNSEEWMLDHALQHVVAQLTPARKRKVQLLVEAFETVTPTIGN
ncbi:hypothetical protein HS088_TW13G00545 [Tripterygium wilfordii]|uniref:Calmodulin-binding domain-containing protein n=1 Tax=Tripterygium wilfordii TaxID=458696 RepID=A0A7J7CU82_TRIWF|nr:calmodulin binding protein PICBP-like [Tripterygium wilfordii]KAF5737657.1 hypothetical protein HS088_TW13G00545 [Tripterygium wilfordii]